MGHWDPADSSTPAPAQCLIAICLLPSWENMLDWSYFMLGLTLSLSLFCIMSLWLSLLVLFLSGLFWCSPIQETLDAERERERGMETERSRRMRGFRGFSTRIKASQWANLNQQSSGVLNLRSQVFERGGLKCTVISVTQSTAATQWGRSSTCFFT